MDDSRITRKDIEEQFVDLKNEADQISGPTTISRRLLTAASALFVLSVIYYAGKRRGQKTKTFVEIIRE